MVAKRELTVEAFFQNGNTESESPPHSAVFCFVEGWSAKTLNGTKYRSEFWHRAQLGNLSSLGPCRAGCLQRGWADATLKVLCSAAGSGSVSAVLVLLCIPLTLLRVQWVAQACGRHSQGLSSFLQAGSSLYLASYALKHLILGCCQGPVTKNEESMLWSVLRKGFKYGSFCRIQRSWVSRTHWNKALILSLNLDSSFERKQSILLGFDFPWYKHCHII